MVEIVRGSNMWPRAPHDSPTGSREGRQKAQKGAILGAAADFPIFSYKSAIFFTVSG